MSRLVGSSPQPARVVGDRRRAVVALLIPLLIVMALVVALIWWGRPAVGVPGGAPAASPTGGITLVGAGDIGDCSATADAATAALIKEIPGVVFTVGDNAYEKGSAHDFADCYAPTWGQFLSRTRPAPGNHDYATKGAQGYFDYFASAAGPPDRGYYAYDLGAWRIYSLNSNCSSIGGCGQGTAEYDWLVSDLKAHAAECVAAFWHHPRFSSGVHGNYSRMQAIWSALYHAGAELVIVGHDHDYERLVPLNGDGAPDPAHGIREIVVGTGGANLRSFGNTILATSQVRNDTSHGVLQLTLYPRSYDWRFVPVAGDAFTDSGSSPCHAAP
ncbi:MAG TPA: metallophosphoesterase [Candidatus Limnocylindria bacterium]|nr:metallophosphoesterase [Candidatus Limnocylindria bacterium]